MQKYYFLVINNYWIPVIKKLRKKFNLSQDSLGKKIEIHGRHIGKYETEKAMPNADTLIKIAKLFNVSIDYLLFEQEIENTSPEINDKKLLKEFEIVDKMNEEDKKIIKSLIDAYIKKNQLNQILKQ